MAREIVPINQMDRRIPEAGRIRMGEKTAKAMKSLPNMRFTSPRRDLILQLAHLYGGTAKAWNEPKSNNANQWQVVVTADDIPVYLVPNGLSTQYEAWVGGGCARRCDGVTCTVMATTPDGAEPEDVSCLCRSQGVRICHPYTRMQVVIPTISFAGVWRLETKGWNAAQELPGMFDMIEALTESGQMIRATLGIDSRSKVVRGRKQQFVVPRLAIEQTALEIQAGAAAANSLGTGQPVATAPALGAGPTVADHEQAFEDEYGIPDGDEIVEAEIISEEETAATNRLRDDAKYFTLDPDRFVAAIRASIEAMPDDRATADRMLLASERMRNNEIRPVGFQPDGRVQWATS
jgi:hypothetical protein